MGTSYKATVSLDVQKQHRCVGCSAVFRYPMHRTATAQDSTAAVAEENAKAQLAKDIMTGFDVHPCPSCGIYQPEMVHKLRGDVTGVVSFVAHVAPGVLGALAAFDVIPWSTAGWSAGGSAAVALLLHVRAATLRPNVDLARNRSRAEREVAEGKLFVETAGSPDPIARPGPGELDGMRKMMLAAFAAAMVALPSFELLRLARGWPLNKQWTPAVIGPGDQATHHFAEKISSVKGHWAGEGAASVAQGAEPATLRVTSKSREWGASIRAKRSEKSSSSTPWAKVQFDERAELAGKVLPVRLELSVRYPSVSGGGFSNQTKNLAFQDEVRLAPPGAGKTYAQLFWWGLFGGSVALCVLGIALVGRKDPIGEASNTEVFVRG